jgi:PAS domain S-box-containing protein
MIDRSPGLLKAVRRNASASAVLMLATVMILATATTAIVLLADLRQQELSAARSQIASLSRILAEQTMRTFEGVTLTMRNTRERLSDDMGSQFELDSLPIHLLLKARADSLPHVRSLFLIDRDGFGVNSSRPDFIRRLSVKERSFFRYFAEGGKDELFISPPEKAKVDGQWTYYSSMRLLDAQGQFRGTLVASISIEHYESLYNSIALDFGVRAQLLNDQGILLAGKPYDDNSLGKQVAPASVQAALRQAPPGTVVETSEHSSTGTSYLAFRRLAGYPLVIALAVDEERALVTWHRISRPIIAGVIGGLLFIVLTTLLMVRNLLRKGALESALKESDEQLRHLVQSVKDAIVIVDSRRKIVLFNSGAETMFSLAAEQAIGADVEKLLATCRSQPHSATLLKYLEEGWRAPSGLALMASFELQRLGEPFPVEMSLSTTTFRSEILLTAIFRDLTEGQRAERALLESNRQLKALSAALENVREEERLRISREIHDELGQLLTGIRMEVSWLGSRLVGKNDELAGKLGSIKGQIDQTIAAVRRISSELRPLVLDDLGFAAAASWYVDQVIGHTGLAISLSLPEAELPQGSPIATALFRVLQESLTNVTRHALATRVHIALQLSDSQWTLSIQDNGCGFQPAEQNRSGIGLIGMRERVQILRGRFSIVAMPGGGTLVEASVPSEETTGVQNAKNRGVAGR